MGSNSVNAEKGSELLSDLAAIVDDEAKRGITALGERIATRIAMEWCGQSVYIPIDRPRRNREIWAEFNGRNYHALARKFRLSERQVRDIVSAEKTRRQRKRCMLPGMDQGEEE